MIDKSRAEYGLNVLKGKGADKAHVVLSESAKRELNVESGEFSLLRTTYNNNISFRTITGNKRGDFSLISGTSIIKYSLDKQVASPGLTLYAAPVSPGY